MPIKFKQNTKKSKRIGLSGKGGCGKSWAITTMYKKPIVLDLEQKWSDEPPFSRIPTVDCASPTGEVTFSSVMQSLDGLINEDLKQYDAVVIDTASEMEKLCINHAIAKDYKGDINKYSAYMTGDNNELKVYFSQFLDLLTKIKEKHDIDILVITHAAPKPEKNPHGEDYTKMALDLKKHPTALCLKWFHYLGFVYDDVKTEKDGLKNVVKSNTRVISFDNKSMLYDAKSLRNDIETTIPFDQEGKWVGKIFNKGGK